MNKNKFYRMVIISISAILVAAFLVACQGAAPVVPTPTLVSAQPTPNNGIVIAVDSGNAPFMYEKDGQAAGLYPDLLQEAFKRMGTTVSIKAYPWKRALALSERGEVGVGGIYKNDARLKIYDYSAPLFSEKILIYVKKGNGFEYKSVDDLKGKTIGVLSGWSYGDAFDQAKTQGSFKVEEVTNDNVNFEKLTLGRVDAVLAIELTAQQIISAKNYDGQVEALSTPLTISDTYLVFAKSAQQTALLEKFNSVLKAMQEDGTYDSLVKNQQ